jgi:hypothetical protein
MRRFVAGAGLTVLVFLALASCGARSELLGGELDAQTGPRDATTPDHAMEASADAEDEEEGEADVEAETGEPEASDDTGAPDVDAGADVDSALDSGADVDAQSQVAVLFGGYPGSGSHSLADTWTWDGTSWTQNLANGAPPERWIAGASSLGNTVLMFAGDGFDATQLGDTWIWDGTTWTQENGPQPLGRETMQLAEYGTGLLLFGGFYNGANAVLGDMWSYQNGWRDLPLPTPMPAARTAGVMVSFQGAVVLFGGNSTSDTPLNDTWQYAGGAWQLLDPGTASSPPPRFGAGAAALGDKIVMFGGNGGTSGLLSDTWTWDGSRWSLAASSGPSGRWLPGMATAQGRAVLFGGSSFRSPLGDTWTWDGTSWTLQGGTGPSPRQGAAMATLTR